MIIKTLKKKFVATRFLEWQSETKSFSHEGEYLGKLQIEHYLDYNFQVEDILHIGHFLFPEFIVKDNLVFLSGREPDTDWNPERTSSSKQEWQSSFTRLNLWDEFSATTSDAEDIWIALAELIEKSWRMALHANFPDRNHIIETSFEEGYDPYVWFYEDTT